MNNHGQEGLKPFNQHRWRWCDGWHGGYRWRCRHDGVSATVGVITTVGVPSRLLLQLLSLWELLWRPLLESRLRSEWVVIVGIPVPTTVGVAVTVGVGLSLWENLPVATIVGVAVTVGVVVIGNLLVGGIVTVGVTVGRMA